MPYPLWPRCALSTSSVAPGGDRHLAARDAERLHDEPGRRLPQPVAGLIVKSRVLAGRENARVIAQPVEKLRAVRLRVDRLEHDPLAVLAALRPVGLRVDVDA